MASLAIEGLKNNINNYKGVMLCTRPNENIGAAKDRPFVSRVDPKDSLGINPVKRAQVIESKKKVNPILAKHRAWLNDFQNKMREKRDHDEQKDAVDKARHERIRELAMVSRVKGSEGIEELNEITATSPKVVKIQIKENAPQEQPATPPVKKTETKKKELKGKPKWAYTEEQVKDEEEMEVDDLLDFTNNLDYDKYINDCEVKNMLTALKSRIDDLNKQDDDWKKKIVDAWNNDKEDRKSVQLNRVEIGDDRSDCRSMMSESKSVASERSSKSIVELKSKLENKDKKDWDTLSTTTKQKQQATIEERIAKHVADEIIRNNTQFRHFHSNASVRKILEKEAQKQMETNKGIKGPEIVASKEYFLRKDVTDPNNLPYLHRNPAI